MPNQIPHNNFKTKKEEDAFDDTAEDDADDTAEDDADDTAENDADVD